MKRLAKIDEDFVDYMYKYISSYNPILKCTQSNNDVAVIFAEVNFAKLSELFKMPCDSISLDYDVFGNKIKEEVNNYNFNYKTNYKVIIYEIEDGIECVFDEKYKY